MTETQVRMVRELAALPLAARISRKEHAEIERVGTIPETTVLTVELAGWLERLYQRATLAQHNLRRVRDRANR